MNGIDRVVCVLFARKRMKREISVVSYLDAVFLFYMFMCVCVCVGVWVEGLWYILYLCACCMYAITVFLRGLRLLYCTVQLWSSLVLFTISLLPRLFPYSLSLPSFFLPLLPSPLPHPLPLLPPPPPSLPLSAPALPSSPFFPFFPTLPALSLIPTLPSSIPFILQPQI